MKTLTTLSLALLLLTTLSLTVVAQESDDRKTDSVPKGHDLTPKYTKGQKSRYRQTQTTDSTSEVMGQKSKSLSVLTYEFEQECTDIADDGTPSLKAKYTRVAIDDTTDGEKTADYDSAEGDKLDELEDGDKLKALLNGLELSFTITKERKVADLKGFDEYKKRVKEQVSEMHAAMLESMNGDATMRDSMEASLRALPTEPVAVGDEWTNEWSTAMPTMGVFTYKVTYKFESVEEKSGHKCAKLKASGEVEFTSEEDAAFEVSISDVEMNGTMFLDLDSRETVFSEMVMKMTMELDMGIKVKTPSTVTTTLELLDGEEADKEETK
ncbi:MAG: hypothetical protein KDB32_08920 [Planctomycetes bacterium]|nr:hypothetical protein [Planctomycetota bacterium]